MFEKETESKTDEVEICGGRDKDGYRDGDNIR